MIRFTCFAAAMALGLASPLQAKVIAQDDDSFVTRDSTVVKASPREVWLALISPGKWWSDAHTWSGKAENMSIVPQGGGCFCERIPGEDTTRSVSLDGSAQHMVVVQAFPDKVLRMRGGLGPLQSEPVEGVLTITLAKVESGTSVVFEYVVGGPMRYEVPTIAKAVDGVMSQQLAGLAELLGEAPDTANDDANDDAKSDETASDKGNDDADKPSVKDAFAGLADSDN